MQAQSVGAAQVHCAQIIIIHSLSYSTLYKLGYLQAYTKTKVHVKIQ